MASPLLQILKRNLRLNGIDFRVGVKGRKRKWVGELYGVVEPLES